MGCVVVERFLEARSGTGGSADGAGAAGRHPRRNDEDRPGPVPAFFDQQARSTRGEYTAAEPAHDARGLLLARTPAPTTCCASRRCSSPSRAARCSICRLLAMRFGRRRPALPVLVVGGEADAVFPARRSSVITAARWQAEVAVIPRAGPHADARRTLAGGSGPHRWLDRPPVVGFVQHADAGVAVDRLLWRQGKTDLGQGFSQDATGDRLAIDEHAVAVENDQQRWARGCSSAAARRSGAAGGQR
jgi:hypothetical protein